MKIGVKMLTDNVWRNNEKLEVKLDKFTTFLSEALAQMQSDKCDLSVVLAPEYYFARAEQYMYDAAAPKKPRRRAITETKFRLVRDAVRGVVSEFPNALVVPGTAVFEKGIRDVPGSDKQKEIPVYNIAPIFYPGNKDERKDGNYCKQKPQFETVREMPNEETLKEVEQLVADKKTTNEEAAPFRHFGAVRQAMSAYHKNHERRYKLAEQDLEPENYHAMCAFMSGTGVNSVLTGVARQEISVGIEICADHLYQTLKEKLHDEYYDLLLEIHIIVSASVPVKTASSGSCLREGSFLFHCSAKPYAANEPMASQVYQLQSDKTLQSVPPQQSSELDAYWKVELIVP